jgi:hypothetical protein
VPGESPVSWLLKLPEPVPSLVFLPWAIVGLGEVPQTTPRAVTASTPSEVIFPPLVALVEPTSPIVKVLKTGGPRVWKLHTMLYAVPTLFVAYARA